MPTSLSAAKRLRQSKKRAAINKRVKSNIAHIAKQAKKALESKDKAKVAELAKKFQKAVDKAIQRNILNANTGARKKSRLLSRLNTL